MHIEIEFLPWLSEQLGGKEHQSRHLTWRVEVRSGETAGEVCARLAADNEAFRRLVFDPDTKRFDDQILLVLNDRLLDLAGRLDAELRDGDKLSVVPAMAGGRHRIRKTSRMLSIEQ